MKTLYILSSLALLALGIPATTGVPTPGVGPFTNCAAEDADFNVSSTVITPAVPCIGQNICLTVSGRLGADIISGASLTIIGHSTNRLLYYDTTDVGTLLAAAGTPLPFPASAPGTNSTLTLCRPFIKSPYWNGVCNTR